MDQATVQTNGNGHDQRALFCPLCIGWGTLEATDLFCGAGGSSLGLEFVCCPRCGRQLVRVTQALNHDVLAVEAHNANFPHADHDVHDVQVVPARRFRRTPLLWASTECTHHAYCRGRRVTDEVAVRSRMTFYDVTRFTEYHRYDVVVVENVVEARLWCDTLGHDEKCNCGSHFEDWFESMIELGYEGQIVYFNSQFALPTPQSRDRIYVMFWRRALPTPPLDFRPLSWCSGCETVVRGVQMWKPASKGSCRAQPGKFEWGRYGSQYLYACPDCESPVAPAVTGARSIIDASLPMHRIGDKPKAPKTRERIKHGLERIAALDPVMVQVGGHLYERRPGVRVWSIDEPLRTVTKTNCMAVVVPCGGQSGQGRNPSSVDEPLGAVTSEDHRALVFRYGGQAPAGREAGEPMMNITAHDREIGLVIPNREHAIGASFGEPVGTVTSAPAQHMLVQVNRSTKGKPVDRNASTLEEPTRTIAGHGELALVEFRGDYGFARPVDVPAHTVTAQGNHHGLLVYNGNPGFVRDLDDALGTVTSRDKQALVIPYNRTGKARSVDEPMTTLTTKDRQALVVTEDDIDDCLFRMLQWPELLAAQQMHRHPDGRPYKLEARRRNKRGKIVAVSNELKVKYIGNAVSSPVSTLFGWVAVKILAPC